MIRKTVLLASLILIILGFLIGCTQEKKPDYSIEINEKGKIVRDGDALMAANKFDEASAAYQKALAELTALKQKVPPSDDAYPSLNSMIVMTNAKLDKISAARQEYEAKITAESKKPEMKPEVKPEAKPEAKSETKPAAKPKVKKAIKPKEKTAPEVKPEAKGEIKGEAQTKAAETAAEPPKKEPVRWKVVANNRLATGEAEWHILCGENLARIVRQDPKKEKPYMGGYGGQWYKTLQEAAAAACSK